MKMTTDKTSGIQRIVTENTGFTNTKHGTDSCVAHIHMPNKYALGLCLYISTFVIVSISFNCFVKLKK